jgi:uncharacterized membrane protein SpoIIM required for sporulation
MKIITLTIIVILFALFILLFVYIYILCNQLDEYDNEHNFRRKEKGYKENNLFLDEINKSNKKYQNSIKK